MQCYMVYELLDSPTGHTFIFWLMYLINLIDTIDLADTIKKIKLMIYLICMLKSLIGIDMSCIMFCRRAVKNLIYLFCQTLIY